MTNDINKIIRIVKETCNPLQIILFGSYVKGEFKEGSDLDVAVIQQGEKRIRQKANIYLNLYKSKYNWEIEPDIHFFSKKEFDWRLKEGDLFAEEVSKGRTVYVKN